MDMTPEINKDEIALYDAAVNYCNEHHYQDNLIYKICFDSFIAGAKWALGELNPRWVKAEEVKDTLSTCLALRNSPMKLESFINQEIEALDESGSPEPEAEDEQKAYLLEKDIYDWIKGNVPSR